MYIGKKSAQVCVSILLLLGALQGGSAATPVLDTTVGVISGTVKGEMTMGPVAGVSVMLYGQGDTVSGYYSQTGSGGEFTFPSVPRAWYAVSFSDPSGAYPYQFYDVSYNRAIGKNSSGVGLVSSAVSIEVILRKNPLADSSQVQTSNPKLHGSIKDGSGRAVAGATIYAYSSSDWFPSGDWGYDDRYVHSSHTAVSDSTGAYSLPNVAAGAWRLMVRCESANFLTTFYPSATQFSGAGTLILYSNDTLGRKVDFTLAAGVHILGNVKDSLGQPVAGLRVAVYPDKATGSATATGARVAKSAFSDSQGRVSLYGVPVGTYYLDLWDDSGYYSFASKSYPRITAAASPMYLYDTLLTVTAGGILKGTINLPITTDSTKYMGNLGQAFVYPTDLSTMHWFSSVNQHAIERTDSAGRYRIRQLPAGSSKVIICPPYQGAFNVFNGNPIIGGTPLVGYRWTYLDRATSFAATAPLSLQAKKTLTKDIVFPTGGWSVPGTIWNDSGRALGSANTWLRIAAFIRVDTFMVMVSASDVRDSGRFVLNGLVEGESYYLHVQGENITDQFWDPSGGTPTRDPKMAQPWTFTATNYHIPSVVVVGNPAGNDESGNNDRLAAVTGLSIRPAGFSALQLQFNALPDSLQILKYKIYRLSEAAKTMFFDDGNGQWSPGDDAALDAVMMTFETADTAYLDTTVQFGSKYLYVVAGVNAKGNESAIDLSTRIPFADYYMKLDAASFPLSSNLAAATWNLVGPGGTDTIRVDSTTAAHPHLFRWDEGNDTSNVYSLYREVAGIVPGEGGWIYADAPQSFVPAAASISRLAARSTLQNITLKMGWNQVSSPFPFAVSPIWLSGSGFAAWEWNADSSSYRQAGAFAPLRGYWIHSEADTVLALPAKPAGVTGLKKAAAPLTAWHASLALFGRGTADEGVEIGVLPAGCARTAAAAVRKPPRGFGGADLALVDEGGTRLARRILPAGTAGTWRWPLEIAPCAEALSLCLSELAVPAEVLLYWQSAHTSLPLGIGDTIRFAASGEVRKGALVATVHPELLALFSGKATLAARSLPGRLALQLMIPYGGEAGISGGTRSVQIGLYNLKGQLLRMLVDEALPAGYQGVGVDASGMAAGMYLLRLRLDGEVIGSFPVAVLR